MLILPTNAFSFLLHFKNEQHQWLVLFLSIFIMCIEVMEKTSTSWSPKHRVWSGTNMSLSFPGSNRGSIYIVNDVKLLAWDRVLHNMIPICLFYFLLTPSKTYVPASKQLTVSPTNPSFCLYPEHPIFQLVNKFFVMLQSAFMSPLLRSILWFFHLGFPITTLATMHSHLGWVTFLSHTTVRSLRT